MDNELHSKKIANLYLSGLSIRRVAEQLELSSGTVAYHLKNLGITRGKAEAAKIKDLSNIQNHIEITPGLQEILDGEMLGDGCFKSIGKSAMFTYGTSNMAYRDYLMELLDKHGVEFGEPWDYTAKDSGYKLYGFSTKSYVEFLDLYNRWYTKEPKRKILAEVELTPTVVRHWYLGDGTLNKCEVENRYRIELFTCSFSDIENRLLAEKLCKLGLMTRTGKIRQYNCLRVSTLATFEFLQYIGEPIRGYEYKWIGGGNYKEVKETKT